MVSSSTPLYTSPNGTVYVLSGADSNCTISVCPVEDSVYGYRPSIPASVTLIALYALCMVVQSIMGVRYKQWGYMTAMLLGCADEILGYVGRILMYQNPFKQPGFIMQIGQSTCVVDFTSANGTCQFSLPSALCSFQLPFMSCSTRCKQETDTLP